MYWATLPEALTAAICTLDALAAGGQHLGGEIDCPVAGCLRTDQAAAIFQGFAGQHGGMLVDDLLVIAIQVANLTPANADIAGWYIRIRANVAIQFAHEGLAEAHHFHVRFALRVKVRTALAAAHRERGQRVFEDLFKAQELDDPEVNGWVKAQAALVGADGVIELDTEAAIYLNISVVIHPGDPEEDGPVRDNDPFVNLGFDKLRVPVNGGLQCGQDFLYCLVELGLAGILFLNPRNDILDH